MIQKNFWIFVESYHNWEQDKKNNFNLIGMDSRKIELKGINGNDIFFTYITKLKKFSDCRRIISTELEVTPSLMKYDKNFPTSIKTEKIKILEMNKWLNYDLIKNELEIFATTTSPQLKLLNAPILISDYDAKTLLNYMMIKDV